MDETTQSSVHDGLAVGCADVWRSIYDAHCHRVWNYVARRLGANKTEVADVVQEIFFAAAKSIQDFDADRGNIEPWLLGIARHRIALYFRKAHQEERIFKAMEYITPSVGQLHRWLLGEDEQPIDFVEIRELRILIHKAMTMITDEYAELLSLRYLDEMGIDEIIQRTSNLLPKTTATAIRSKLARARKAFREEFSRLTADDVSDCPQ